MGLKVVALARAMLEDSAVNTIHEPMAGHAACPKDDEDYSSTDTAEEALYQDESSDQQSDETLSVTSEDSDDDWEAVTPKSMSYGGIFLYRGRNAKKSAITETNHIFRLGE